jgi:hypothetical protein
LSDKVPVLPPHESSHVPRLLRQLPSVETTCVRPTSESIYNAISENCQRARRRYLQLLDQVTKEAYEPVIRAVAAASEMRTNS